MRVAVVGAGVAGLAAACELADLGHTVTLFERRPWAGGKTYSHLDARTGEEIDNGQHIFMACTTAYIDFLRKLGTLRLTRRQRRLRAPVFDATGRRSDLSASALPPPLHFGPSFARYRHLGLADRLRAGRLLLRMHRIPAAERDALEGASFGDWLRSRGQSDAAVAGFWDFMVMPTLNCRSDAASAAAALFVLQEGFLSSRGGSAVGIPAVGLSSLHVRPAIEYVRARGGDIRMRNEVARLETDAQTVRALITRDGERLIFDGYVCALPPRAVPALFDGPGPARGAFDPLASMPMAAIVNVHLWFDRPVAPWSFAAFTGCELQWVFNRTRIGAGAGPEEHLVVSLSAADAYLDQSKSEIIQRLLPQLNAAIPGTREAQLARASVLKEPDATFVPAPGLKRPPPETPFGNLVLAGSYTSTGWPATMESAVRSGLAAVRVLAEGLAQPERSQAKAV